MSQTPRKRRPGRVRSLLARFARGAPNDAYLSPSEEHYRRLFEVIPIPIWVYDLRTLAFLQVNDACTERYGYSRDEFLSSTMKSIWPPDDVPARLAELAENPTATRTQSVRRYQKKNGTILLFEVTSYPLVYESREARVVIANDVTERNRAVEELERQRAFLRQVIDINPNFVFAKDRAGRFTLVNQAVASLYGTTVEDLLGKTDADFASSPAEAEDFRKSDLEVMDSRREMCIPEEKFTDPRGNVRWLEKVKRPIVGSDGRVDHVLGVAVDITDRKRFEDELKRSEERFRLVACATNDVVWDWSLVTDSVWWNEGVLTLFGYDPAAAASDSSWWSYHVDPEQRLKVIEGIQHAIEGGGPSWQDEYRFRRSDGSYADVIDRGFIIRDESGRAIRMIGALRDMTKQKHSEEALRASEERYRLLFENNPQPMWVFDDESLAFLAVNKAACHHYGYTRDEFLGMTIRDIRPPEDIPALARQIASESSEYQQSGVWRHRKKDGTVIEVEIASHPLVFENRGAQLILALDVTERRKLEAQARQSQKMEAVGQLAGGVAHDFNNLLTAILGYAELLAPRLRADPSGLEEVAEITKAGERAASLTRQLLAFSRRQVLEPKVLDLNASVRSVEKMLRRLIGEHIDLVATLDSSLAPVRADAGQIEQVILNLVVNARDAMPDGGKITIETANVEHDDAYARQHVTGQPGKYVMIAVTDTGIGMDAATQSRIFEPFFTTKAKDKGTGLGLSTVYGIVKQSGGYIWTYSEVARGTTFKVYLPRVEGVAEAIESPSPKIPAARATGTILLVEDDASLRKLALTILKGIGYTVLDAGTGADAIEITRKHTGTIDLVLTDVVMPEMSGPDLVSALRAARPGVPVLYMSGYTDDAIIRHNVLEPGVAFLQKPFTPASLARKLREVLDARD
jgi:two-component system cell cycle sensor histidine kinase/response regulator CckA